jgi:hypothetical protein
LPCSLDAQGIFRLYVSLESLTLNDQELFWSSHFLPVPLPAVQMSADKPNYPKPWQHSAQGRVRPAVFREVTPAGFLGNRSRTGRALPGIRGQKLETRGQRHANRSTEVIWLDHNNLVASFEEQFLYGFSAP